MLKDYQIIQPGSWRYWLMLGGKGSGKTKTGATEIRKRVYKQEKGLSIVAPKHEDLIKVMVPAIVDEFPPHHKPEYIGGSTNIIRCHNGVQIDCRTSQQGEIRGPNNSFVWLDEIINCWDRNPEKVEYNFNVFDTSIRKGSAQILITTTGQPWKIFKDWLSDRSSRTVITTGRMRDNEYLAPSSVKDLEEKFQGSRFARLELDGIIDFDVDGAYWTQKALDQSRVGSPDKHAPPRAHLDRLVNPPNPKNHRYFHNPIDYFKLIVIATDPAMTVSSNSDDTGIIVAGMSFTGHFYVLEDRSGKHTPEQTTRIIQELRNTYRTPFVVAESNQGGEWIRLAMRAVDPSIDRDLKLISVSQNKMTRAQPLVILWDQGKAHLCGFFPELENQMTTYTGDPSQKSPDRFDAMTLAMQYISLEPVYTTSNFTSLPRF